jgi:WD40 repeat protein
MEAEPATFGANIPVFTPDHEQFVHPWNFGNGIVDVYDVASGERLERLTDVADAIAGGDAYMLVPRFASDGNRLVTPSWEEWVAVYDPATWDLIELIEPEDGFREIVFLPDGERAITLSEEGLEIRDAADLRTVLAGPVPSEEEPGLGRVLEITTDGRYLKTAGVTGAQLWDAETLQPIGGLFPDDAMAWSATLASDTNQLATTIDGALVVWNIELDEWPEIACLAAGRNLTRAEWEEFGPAGEYHATCDRWPSG